MLNSGVCVMVGGRTEGRQEGGVSISLWLGGRLNTGGVLHLNAGLNFYRNSRERVVKF